MIINCYVKCNTEKCLRSDLILCDNPKCDNTTHRNAIDRMYFDIMNALDEAIDPLSNKTMSSYKQVLGWNDFCKDAHDQALLRALEWVLPMWHVIFTTKLADYSKLGAM